MKYWPPRSAVEGFSIENLAKQYRLKIADRSNALKGLNDDVLNAKGIHWANRAYDEYRNAA